jgi:hypothetical protein
MIDDVLSVVRRPAFARQLELMDRVPPGDLTPLEVMALLAILESADQRVNARTAPVFELVRPSPAKG